MGLPPDPAAPRPPPDFNIAADDPAVVAAEVDGLDEPDTEGRRQKQASTQDARESRLRDRQDRADDRMESSALWQQRLVLAFIGFVLVFLCFAAAWSFVVLISTDKSPRVEVAHDLVKLLIESGIAALIGFFAIKTFEK